MTQVTSGILVSKERSLSSVVTFKLDMHFVFCFPQLQGSRLLGKHIFTFVSPILCLKDKDAAAACLTKLWAEVTQTLLLEKQVFPLQSSIVTLSCKAACLLSLKPGLFVKQRQHHYISLMLEANISSK